MTATREFYIACDGMKFEWEKDELEEFKDLWNKDEHQNMNNHEKIWLIANEMNEDPDDLLLLAFDLLKKRKVK